MTYLLKTRKTKSLCLLLQFPKVTFSLLLNFIRHFLFILFIVFVLRSLKISFFFCFKTSLVLGPTNANDNTLQTIQVHNCWTIVLARFNFNLTSYYYNLLHRISIKYIIYFVLCIEYFLGQRIKQILTCGSETDFLQVPSKSYIILKG